MPTSSGTSRQHGSAMGLALPLAVALFLNFIDVASCFLVSSNTAPTLSWTPQANRPPRPVSLFERGITASMPSRPASSPAVATGLYLVSGRAQPNKRCCRLEAKKGKADKKSGRPSLDDVERLSRGEAAKRRGTGSRAVCHRLNESERKAYDLAKKQGYVVLRGTGYRRERKGSPLLNTFRQFCDAKAMACASVVTGQGPDATDEVEIDFSPLRCTGQEITDSMGERADAIAADLGAIKLRGDEEGDRVTVGIAVRTTVVADEQGPREDDGVKLVGTEATGEKGEEKDKEEGQEEEEDEEWSGDLNAAPIWRLPVVSQVYQCATRKAAKDVAQALSTVR